MALLNKRTPRRLIKGRTDNLLDSTADTNASASMAGDIFSQDPNYVNGTITPVMYHIDLIQEDVDELRRFLTGSMTIPSGLGDASSAGEVGLGTEIITLHNSQTLQAGATVYSGASSWAYANATSAGAASYGFMGVTKSSSTGDGIITRGVIYVSVDPGGSVGDVVYLNTADGRLTTTAPSADGNVVRIMGHKLGTNLVYFNPSTNWVELTV